MAYDNQLYERLLSSLQSLENVETKFMFGGVCFMVNDKMCIGIIQDNLMCRIGPEQYEKALEMPGCRPMDFASKPMKGYVYVEKESVQKKAELEYWINCCLQFNPLAQKSKKRAKNT
tara:strand:+ start:152 stop:502 length:351 start_codon:yes stop_codon:yes gene_type:complete